jgi:hypothetical protein
MGATPAREDKHVRPALRRTQPAAIATALHSVVTENTIMFMNLLRSDIAPDPRTRCRACGTTAYRKVIARDAEGRLTANGMYQCTGCPLQFKTLNEWRGSPGRGSTFLGGLAAQRPAQGQFAL